MLRRSDFIAATYALSLVFANFGIAIAARMPMMTTTIKSSMSVKPFLLRDMNSSFAYWRRRDATVITSETGRHALGQRATLAPKVPNHLLGLTPLDSMS